MDRLLTDLQEDPSFADLPSTPRFGRILSQSIQTLRMNAVAPSSLRDRADAQGGTLAAVALGYARYVELLETRALYDAADIFRWATAHVETHGVPDGTAYAVCDSVELPGWPFRFLSALRETGAPFYRVGGASSPDDAPPGYAARRFATVQRPRSSGATPGGSPSAEPAAPPRFRAAIGTTNEVRGVLREILARRLPLDTVEIAYTSSTPYLPLLADEAERLGLPLTLGPGVPAGTSRAGQRLRGVYDWITSEYDPALLVRLLRSGHLRLDRWASAAGPAHPRPDAASAFRAGPLAATLAEQRYAPGRAGIEAALNGAIERAKDALADRKSAPADQGAAPAVDTADLEAEIERLEAAKEFVVGTLLKTWFAPGDAPHDAFAPRMTVPEMAAASLKVLDQLGRNVDDLQGAEARTLDSTAHKVLRENLETLTAFPFEYRVRVPRLAALFREVLCGAYVQAEQPRPGAVHVLPLSSAGFNGRPHLFVVGMDSATLSASPVDDPLLRDDDVAGLGAAVEEASPQHRADAQLWEMETALDRHNGPATFYRCAFDLAAAEERFPASLVLRRQRRHTQTTGTPPEEPRVGFAPDASGLALDDPTAWLMARLNADPASGPASAAPAREALHDAFPHLRHGAHARAQRASAAYTPYDGCLSNGPYPELDFRDRTAYAGRVVSANRLERLAESPYAYFLMDVLGVRAPEEPALDDEPWLSPRRRGSILHATFEAFLSAVGVPTEDDRDALRHHFDAAFQQEVDRHAPPSDLVEDTARRQLWADADVFFRVECAEASTFTPHLLEWSVGMPPHRRAPHDGPTGFVLSLSESLSFRFRGKVDRIDTLNESLAVWDYKSGAQRFAPSEPLSDGGMLQWALYAYAVEQVLGQPVTHAGYYHATAREMGARLHANPRAHRDDVAALVSNLADAVRSGDFGMSTAAADAAAWRFGDLHRICPDVRARCTQLKAKA